MTPSKMISGMRGVYLVAAELSRLGFIVSPTSRGALGADLLVTDQLCRNAFSVQVKTNQRNFGFWLLNQKAKEIISTNHIYVLVNIRKAETEYFVVPSKMVSKYMYTETSKTGKKSTFYSISLSDMQKYKDKWDLFGKSSEDDT